MGYHYKLAQEQVEKFGFTDLICNGWFGIYADSFNEKWNNNTRVGIQLSDGNIDEIIQNAISCIEIS